MEVILVEQEMLSEEDSAFLALLPDNFQEAGPNWTVLAATDEEGYVYGVLGYAVSDGFEHRIEWLYVDEDARRKGVATLLLDRFYDMIESFGGYPVVLPYDRNTPQTGLDAFIRSYGNMVIVPAYRRYRILKEDRQTSKYLAEMRKKKGEIHPFFEQPGFRQNAFLEKLEQLDMYEIRDRRQWENNCEKELCLCGLKDGQIDSAVFVLRTDETEREIGFLYSEQPQRLSGLIAAAANEMDRVCPDAALVAETVAESAERMLNAFFPNAAVEAEICEAVWDYSLRGEARPDYGQKQNA